MLMTYLLLAIMLEKLKSLKESLSKSFGRSGRKKECNTRTSQGVTHPSTTLAQARLTSEF